jgi:hypothetical protein
MMNAKLKVFIAALLVTSLFSREKIFEHLGFAPVDELDALTIQTNQDEVAEESVHSRFNLVSVRESPSSWGKSTKAGSAEVAENIPEGPIEILWTELEDIDYELKYFEELDMEIYSPIFPPKIRALHEKQVVIKGYVIPFDADKELLSLSANPYASCFFCGAASPASVMSMYLKNKRKRYKMDDFKTFSGTLYLNSDDPNQFYYILRDAVEE